MPEWSAIPVLVVTADANAREKAQALSVAGYLRKPVKLRELLDVVAHWLQEKST